MSPGRLPRCPIIEDGHCVGTLCIIDRRFRVLGSAELSLLHDLRDLALEELKRRPQAG